MEFYLSVLFLVIVSPFSQSSLVLNPLSSINIPYDYEADGVTGLNGIEQDAVEQFAYDAISGLVYTGGTFDVGNIRRMSVKIELSKNVYANFKDIHIQDARSFFFCFF